MTVGGEIEPLTPDGDRRGVTSAPPRHVPLDDRLGHPLRTGSDPRPLTHIVDDGTRLRFPRFRRPVFADRADVAASAGVPMTLIASHWLPPGDGRTHGQITDNDQGPAP